MKHIKLFEQFIGEGYMDNFKEYEKEFKKRGLKRHSEDWSEGGYEDLWYKDFELGRFVVGFYGDNLAINNPKIQSQYQEYQYSIWFEPFPKYQTKLFGLIKSKDRQLGKQIRFAEGQIDFSTGLFAVDDKKFIKDLFKLVDDALVKAEEVSTVEYLSAEDSKIWGRPAIDNIR
jgi:hypothetical protein